MKRKSYGIIALVLLLAMAAGCSKTTGPAAGPQVDPIDDNYRVFYQIFVGSFSDSDGDGTGDLKGIINRMDYLNDGNVNSGESLGVQGLWLSPVFASPSYHKYDTTSYYRIDPAFGTEEDLKELLDICHERNVKVILDLVINHTSTSNLWYKRFELAQQAGRTDDKYYNFYSWADNNSRIPGSAYSKISGTDHYYECNFSGDMPELNYDNEEVFTEMLNVAKYWLDLGVDGFRFDAIKYIYFGNTPKSVEFWKKYMAELKKMKPDIYCVGECWSADAETLQYISALNCFNFQMAQAEGYIANAAKGSNIAIFTGYVEDYQDKVQKANPDAMTIPFISNHDMDRAAGYLTLASNRSKMAANLYILSFGSPFIYYGEEIGLKGSRGSSNTDANRRLAMFWGDGDTVKDPVGTTYDSAKQTNGSVENQLKDEDSQLRYYQKLIALRNKYPEIARGEYDSLEFGISSFGGFRITYEGSEFILLHNTKDKDAEIDLSTCSELKGAQFRICDFIGQGEASLEGNTLTTGPQTSVILKRDEH